MPQGARTPREKEAELDRRLQASLAEFDELMKEDRQRMDRRRAQAPAPGGGSDGSAGGPGGFGGGDFADGGPVAGDEGEPAGDAPPDPASGRAGSETEEATQGGVAGDPSRQGADPRVPSDIPAGDGDDIVARQLREAAMAEEDPELREKLWQEYRDYKSGKKRPQEGAGTAEETSP